MQRQILTPVLQSKDTIFLMYKMKAQMWVEE